MKKWRFTLLILIFLTLLLIRPGIQAEEALTLSVDPADSPLVITGRLNDSITAFTGNVRLTLSGGETADVQLLATDLSHDAHADWDISRSHVTMPTGLTFYENQPRDVPITVSNVAHPGKYSGELRFLLPDQALEDAPLVPFELNITATPQVTAVEPNLSLQLVRCGNRVSCWWASRFVGEAATQDKWQLFVENETEQPVQIESAAILLRGQKTADSVRSGDLQIDVPLSIPASQVEPIEMVIQRKNLAPDRYEGTVRLQVERVDTPLVVNLSLDVRDGPLVPLLIIILGILVGRLARGMNTEVAQLQRELMSPFQAVRAKAYSLTDEKSRNFVLSELKQFKQQLDQGSQPAETLRQTMTRLENMTAFLLELEALIANQQPFHQDRIRDQVDAIRDAILNGNEAEAQRQYQALKDSIPNLLGDAPMGELGRERPLATQLVELQERLSTIWETVEHKTVSTWFRFLAGISGIRVTAGVNFWLIRPLLWLLLLIILTLVGMQTLYVSNGASFGAGGINDYLGLFLWGLTGDVASATLANWQTPPK